MDKLICWLQNVFEIDSNTSATIVITISVFLIGLLLQWLYLTVKNLNSRYRHRKMFIHLLRETIKSSHKQGEFFQKLVNSLRIEYIGHYDLNTVNLGYLTVFEKLDFKESFSAFFYGIENLCSKHKLKGFTKAHSAIFKTIGLEKKYPSDLEEFIKKFNEYEDKWNETIELIRQQYEYIFANIIYKPEIIKSKNQVDFFHEMDRIIYDWQLSENRTHFSIVFDKLISPLRNHLMNPKFEEIAVQLKEFSNKLISAEGHYENMKTTLAIYSDLFATYGMIYRNNKRYFELIIKILNN